MKRREKLSDPKFERGSDKEIPTILRHAARRTKWVHMIDVCWDSNFFLLSSSSAFFGLLSFGKSGGFVGRSTDWQVTDDLRSLSSRPYFYTSVQRICAPRSKNLCKQKEKKKIKREIREAKIIKGKRSPPASRPLERVSYDVVPMNENFLSLAFFSNMRQAGDEDDRVRVEGAWGSEDVSKRRVFEFFLFFILFSLQDLTRPGLQWGLGEPV